MVEAAASCICCGVSVHSTSKPLSSRTLSFPFHNISYLSSFHPIRLVFKLNDPPSFSCKPFIIKNRNSNNTSTNDAETSNKRVVAIATTSSTPSLPSKDEQLQNNVKKQKKSRRKTTTVTAATRKEEGRSPVDVRTLYQNGDPLGRRDLGKSVVRWISEGMKAMASDFASAEVQGEFSEVLQRMGPGLTFVIQAQPYFNSVPMPLGLESLCLKACTHYPTLFDHFQRELRDVLQHLQRTNQVQDWRNTHSWKLLKELANSGSF